MVTYQPLIKAIRAELKAFYDIQGMPYPDYTFELRYDNVMYAYYNYRKEGKRYKGKIDFNIEYI
jgi:hypothetical protein